LLREEILAWLWKRGKEAYDKEKKAANNGSLVVLNHESGLSAGPLLLRAVHKGLAAVDNKMSRRPVS
jgi:hypothetical protein